MKFYSTLLAACTATALMVGCSDSSTTPPTNNNNQVSTFSKIQTEIFAKSCATAGCHAGATPTGNMSLEPNVALANLVDITPLNDSAKGHGLRRVRPGKPDSSLLYLKVAGLLKQGYGMRMPLGSAPLSDGKIEFIRQWIQAGAPTTGSVADTNLLSSAAQPFVPPAAPGKGVQIRLKPFDVAAHSERELFYFTRTPNTSTIYVNKFQVKMRDNSHHFILYTYPSGSTMVPPEGVFRDQGGDMEQYAVARNFFLGSQVADFTYEFPDGVALPLQGGAGLDMNSHYVNPGSAPIQGEVYVNLHTIDNPARVAKDFFWVKQDFTLHPFTTTVVRDTQSYANDIDIFMLTSHMHKRGQRFRIFVVGGANDGEMIYESTDWHLPVVKTFDTPLRLKRGQKLRLEATYYNGTEFPIRFGLTSEDEMCIAVGYFALA